jgi:hypothetical protein
LTYQGWKTVGDKIMIRHSLIALTCLATTALASCATIMEGTGQSVAIATTPPAALCSVNREGQTLGQVAATPGSVRIDKSKNDLTVTCSKPGYQTASITQTPKFLGTTFGNILLGGAIGAVVDASTGANYEYPGQINLELAAAAPIPPTPLTPTGPLTTVAPTATPAYPTLPIAAPMPTVTVPTY